MCFKSGCEVCLEKQSVLDHGSGKHAGDLLLSRFRFKAHLLSILIGTHVASQVRAAPSRLPGLSAPEANEASCCIARSPCNPFLMMMSCPICRDAGSLLCCEAPPRQDQELPEGRPVQGPTPHSVYELQGGHDPHRAGILTGQGPSCTRRRSWSPSASSRAPP